MNRVVDEVRAILQPHDPAPRQLTPGGALRQRLLARLAESDDRDQTMAVGSRRWFALAAVAVVVAGVAALAYAATRPSSSTTGLSPERSTSPPTITSPTTISPTTAPPPTTTAPPTTVPTTSPPTTIGTTGGFPNETTTGPRPGTQFRPMAGMTIREDGLVIEDVEVDDGFDVYANDVTIRNCRIRASGYWGVQLRDGYTNLTIENCEIFGDGTNQLEVAIKNISDGHITVRRNNIHTATDGFMGEHGLIEDNYIHDLKEFPGDHVDGIQSNGSDAPGALTIRHNTVINPVGQTSAIILGPTFGSLHDVTIENNLLAGGGYTLYGGEPDEGHPHPVRDIVVRGNVFSRRVFPDGGYYGPVAHWDGAAPGNTWSGNVWEDSGDPVEP